MYHKKYVSATNIYDFHAINFFPLVPREPDQPNESPTSTPEDGGNEILTVDTDSIQENKKLKSRQLHVPKCGTITQKQYAIKPVPYTTKEKLGKHQREPKLDKFGREIIQARCPHCSHYGYIVFPEIAHYPTCRKCGLRVNPPRPITSHMRRNSGFICSPSTRSSPTKEMNGVHW